MIYQKPYFVLDYETDWYDDNFHCGYEKEQKTDKTLSYFSYICYLYKHRIIKEQESAFLYMKLIEY